MFPKIAVAILLVFSSHFITGEVTGMEAMKLSSAAFKQNQPIPSKYSCEGMNVNPALTFENVPAGAKSLALIVDDPDAPAGTWVHWVVWNIDPKTREIGEGQAPSGAAQGRNDFKKNSYGGPCPPSGTHRYFFKLYALDTDLKLGDRTDKAGLEKAMKGHVLAESDLVGLYQKK